MSDVKWIKIVTDIFDDEKMLLIEGLPSADSIIVIWFKLLCLAGKNNNQGVFLLNDRIAYTEEMLAMIFRRDINTVRLALNAFEEFGMIEIIDGVITIPNWGKHQNLDKIEQRNEYMRGYMQKYREKQKERIECKSNGKVNSKANVSDAEEDIEKEVERETENNNVSSLRSDTSSDKSDLDAIVSMWNELDGLGDIKGIRSIGNSGDRIRLTRARLKEYGLKGFREMIDKIKISDFLQGKSGKKPWVVTYDWAVRPNNFKKILEGNYDNKGDGKGDWYK